MAKTPVWGFLLFCGIIKTSLQSLRLYMTDKFIRHFIAFMGLLAFGIVYWAGYSAGQREWWWAAILVPAIYYIIYKLVDA